MISFFTSFKLKKLKPLISALSHCFKETFLLITGASKISTSLVIV